MILEEGHKSHLSLHSGMTKMSHDLKESFWWSGMKRDKTQIVVACLTCQKAQVKHQRSGELLQPLDIPERKWDNIVMDFVVYLPRSVRGHDAVWVIVDKVTKTLISCL